MRWQLFFVLALVVLLCVGAGGSTALAETVEELRESLKTKKESLLDVEKRIEKFKEDIQIKKKEARTLEDQIGIIEDSITQMSLNIDQTVAEIEATGAEIDTVEREIQIKEEEISRQKGLLAEYLRSLYNLNQQSSVTVFLKYSTFSEAMNEASTLEELQQRGQKTLTAIKQLREELEQKKQKLEDFRKTLETLQERQEQQQAALITNKESKARILDLTKSQESEYQRLLQEAKEAHNAANSEIKRLDEKIREELRKRGISKLPSVGIFDWPVQPNLGISCEFHCSDYPYAYLIGPHSGIDIPKNVGTPVLAPADGYVARVNSAGGSGYNYLLLLHGDNLSTVFGHLSSFTVNEGQMVTRGTVIGYTGGAPGSPGAGLSSGPHLHFEVRENNVPVNPRKFL
ncbi:MAG: peptidoglycan DD-metalloendopeptidase family protein [bacterium]